MHWAVHIISVGKGLGGTFSVLLTCPKMIRLSTTCIPSFSLYCLSSLWMSPHVLLALIIKEREELYAQDS